MILSLFAWLNPKSGSKLKNYQRTKLNSDQNSGVSSGAPKLEVGSNKNVGVPMILSGKASTYQGRQSINMSNASSSKVSKGNPWLAIIIAMALTAYLLFVLFSSGKCLSKRNVLFAVWF